MIPIQHPKLNRCDEIDSSGSQIHQIDFVLIVLLLFRSFNQLIQSFNQLFRPFNKHCHLFWSFYQREIDFDQKWSTLINNSSKLTIGFRRWNYIAVRIRTAWNRNPDNLESKSSMIGFRNHNHLSLAHIPPPPVHTKFPYLLRSSHLVSQKVWALLLARRHFWTASKTVSI